MPSCMNIDPGLAYMFEHPGWCLCIFWGSYIAAGIAANFVKGFMDVRRQRTGRS